MMRVNHYKTKDCNRELSRRDISTIWDLFNKDKITPNEIAKMLNLTIDKVNGVLFNGIKPFSDFVSLGVCAFGKQTAYWENEEELAESFEPKYNFDSLDDKELAWFRYASKQTKVIMSAFK